MLVEDRRAKGMHNLGRLTPGDTFMWEHNDKDVYLVLKPDGVYDSVTYTCVSNGYVGRAVRQKMVYKIDASVVIN